MNFEVHKTFTNQTSFLKYSSQFSFTVQQHKMIIGKSFFSQFKVFNIWWQVGKKMTKTITKKQCLCIWKQKRNSKCWKFHSWNVEAKSYWFDITKKNSIVLWCRSRSLVFLPQNIQKILIQHMTAQFQIIIKTNFQLRHWFTFFAKQKGSSGDS